MPGKRYAILEARDAIGGTWDLFRYPGMRSDSDMYTLGYPFRPWTTRRRSPTAPSILPTSEDTAREYGIDAKIRFGHGVSRAEWSSRRARWTVQAERTDKERGSATPASFLYLCTGYYDYDGATRPSSPGEDDFHGPGRASAALARRPRPRRQADRRHRQRGDRGDARARDGRAAPRT